MDVISQVDFLEIMDYIINKKICKGVFQNENENTKNERAFNAFTPEELYVIIDRYLHPQEVAETYTIHC